MLNIQSLLQQENIGKYLLFLYALVCGVSRAATHIVVGLLFIVFLVYCFNNRKYIFDILPKQVIKWFLIMAIGIFISVLFSLDKINSLKSFGLFIYFILPLFYAFCFINNENDLLKFLVIASVSIGINGLANIWQAINGVVKTRGFLGIMDTGALFGMIIPIIFILFLRYEKVKNKLYIGLFILLEFICLTGLWLNATRAAWLGAFIAIVLFLLCNFSQMIKVSKQKFILLIIIACIIGSFIIYNELNSKKNILNFELSSKNRSNAMRIVMWQYGLGFFSKNPIFGVGIGTLSEPIFEKPPSIKLTESIPGKYGHVHSVYIQLLATTGLVGFITYFTFWYNIVLKEIVRSLFFTKQGLFWANIMLTSLVYFSINAATDYLLINMPMLFFSLIVGVCYKGLLLSSKKEP